MPNATFDSDMKKVVRPRKQFMFVGRDSQHKDMSEKDGTIDMSYQEKFSLICQLTLFEYQFKNKTNDIPRFLRTTACIRKA